MVTMRRYFLLSFLMILGLASALTTFGTAAQGTEPLRRSLRRR